MEMIDLGKSKRGFPTLSENGGGATNTGHSRIVAGKDGEKLRPIYVPRGGHLAGREHAIFVVEEGNYVIFSSHHRGDFSITISVIEKLLEDEYERAYAFGFRPEEIITEENFEVGDDGIIHYKRKDGSLQNEVTVLLKNRPLKDSKFKAVLKKINEFSEGEWDHDPTDLQKKLAQVAIEKATCYHCREPHYVAE